MRPIITVAFFVSVLFVQGCQKTASSPKKDDAKQLSIKIKNITPRILYATCFAHMKKEFSTRWRWHKTEVHKLEPKKEVVINLGRVEDTQDIPAVYGTLGVFTSQQEADNAIYELMSDQNKLDLDQISKLKEHTLIIGVEKYGIIGDIFDYDFVPDSEPAHAVQELDFVVENQTGRPVYVAGFMYQKKEDMNVWRYDKTPVVCIEPGEQKVIDVDTLTENYDRRYMRGYLAVFDKHEEHEARNATFQLLKSHQKIRLGRLAALTGRKVILNNQKYGILGDVIDFTVKDISKITFNSHDSEHKPEIQTISH